MTEPLPHIERVEILKYYAQRHDLHTLIETGTAEGFTVSHVLENFKSIMTIELDPDLCERARVRFEAFPHVQCVQGDSAEVLPRVVGSLDEPVLFWLDGHFCGGAVRGEIDTPIRAELEAVVRAPAGSVILIDDMRCFGGMDDHTEEYKDYPHVNVVKNRVEAAGFDFEVVDDVGRCTPHV